MCMEYSIMFIQVWASALLVSTTKSDIRASKDEMSSKTDSHAFLYICSIINETCLAGEP